MTQDEFNEKVCDLLGAILDHVGEGKPSESKHGIVGDPMADMLWEFRWKLPVTPEQK